MRGPGHTWLLAVSALLLLTRASAAQTVVRVLDADGAPVPYALVSVQGEAARVTDSSGVTRFPRTIDRTATLRARRIGFLPFVGSGERREGEAVVVVLRRAQTALDTVRAFANRTPPLSRTGFYDRLRRVQDGAITGSFLTPEELEQRNPTLVSQALQGLPSIRLQRAADGRAIVLGRGGCPMTILLDGHRLNGLLQESASARSATSLNPRGQYRAAGSEQELLSIDQAIVAAEVMAIEMYPSLANAPSELVPLTGGGGCGVIAIWTGARR